MHYIRVYVYNREREREKKTGYTSVGEKKRAEPWARINKSVFAPRCIHPAAERRSLSLSRSLDYEREEIAVVKKFVSRLPRNSRTNDQPPLSVCIYTSTHTCRDV